MYNNKNKNNNNNNNIDVKNIDFQIKNIKTCFFHFNKNIKKRA